MTPLDVPAFVSGWGRRLGRGVRYRLRRLKYEEPFSRVYRVLHRRTHSLTVAGTTVRFHMRTPAEHRRFVRLTPTERPVIEDLLERVEPDDVVYDVGANVGVYTCALANHVGRVVAFEPDPETAARAEANLRLNGLDGTATVHRWALSDTTGTAHLAKHDEGGVGGGRYGLVERATDADATVAVETRVGDELLQEGVIPPPDVVKIDVEGGEGAVLDGLEETLAGPHCRLVYCEVHPGRLARAGRSADAVAETLERAGFVVTRFHDRAEEYFLRATKPESVA